MIINTCSGAMSLARALEDNAAQFYEGLSQRYAQKKDLFRSFAEENREYITQVERAYYGVISDAIEGCFAFHLNPDEYALQTELGEMASLAEAIKKAIEVEEKIIRFYGDAAEQSKSLMADVPRAFKMVAKKRSHRLSALNSLL